MADSPSAAVADAAAGLSNKFRENSRFFKLERSASATRVKTAFARFAEIFYGLELPTWLIFLGSIRLYIQGLAGVWSFLMIPVILTEFIESIHLFIHYWNSPTRSAWNGALVVLQVSKTSALLVGFCGLMLGASMMAWVPYALAAYGGLTVFMATAQVFYHLFYASQCSEDDPQRLEHQSKAYSAAKRLSFSLVLTVALVLLFANPWGAGVLAAVAALSAVDVFMYYVPMLDKAIRDFLSVVWRKLNDSILSPAKLDRVRCLGLGLVWLSIAVMGSPVLVINFLRQKINEACDSVWGILHRNPYFYPAPNWKIRLNWVAWLLLTLVRSVLCLPLANDPERYQKQMQKKRLEAQKAQTEQLEMDQDEPFGSGAVIPIRAPQDPKLRLVDRIDLRLFELVGIGPAKYSDRSTRDNAIRTIRIDDTSETSYKIIALASFV